MTITTDSRYNVVTVKDALSYEDIMVKAAARKAEREAVKLDVTRRVYAIDAITGERTGHLVRNFTMVG